MSEQIAILRSVGGLVFDATFKESHESPMEVTENPVESGVKISDHAYLGPKRLTIEAGVSDVLLRERDNDPFASEVSRSRRAFELLQQLQAKREPFDVQTGLKLYSNMVCTNVRADQDKDTSGAFFFTADLREVIIVYTKTVTYPERKPGPTKNQASETKDKGEQQGNETKDPKKQSILTKAAEAIKGKKDAS